MPNDFDENGNFRSAHIFPSGIEKIKQALGIVPPAMIYFASSDRAGSILDALKKPNVDVEWKSYIGKPYVDYTRNDWEQLRVDHPELFVNDQFAHFSKGVTFNPPTPYDGPDMNEVDAALEAIERMEE